MAEMPYFRVLLQKQVCFEPVKRWFFLLIPHMWACFAVIWAYFLGLQPAFMCEIYKFHVNLGIISVIRPVLEADLG